MGFVLILSALVNVLLSLVCCVLSIDVLCFYWFLLFGYVSSLFKSVSVVRFALALVPCFSMASSNIRTSEDLEHLIDRTGLLTLL